MHGPNRSHNSDACKLLKREAKKKQRNGRNKFPTKINRFGEEVHTLLEFATKAMNDAKAEKRRKTENELNNFERLTVSDSENNA